ncbi:MTH1187 family thiamine-binding protein [Haloarcula sp. S1CR25-12]|uniref:MTH1187 family thiamine-binding protein n=1 Tax=Haloarcula saliterrae TaxID=2950534 RepID=A0ABU2FCW4_9EURY|nr:MTH1187 family thiamine-binding protein [Haloarcula sp. S1CR25-12]MDS0259581.1 MTH1187 family thiamine-binding protein [Haloarcula sp. S1CR25-12]
MTCIGFLSVAPVVEESMAPYVADAVAALDEFDVAYETTPMGTVIEADDSEELFAAAHAAHEAVGARSDRVETFLKIDDKRGVDQRASEKVDAVERELGRDAKSDAEGGD